MSRLVSRLTAFVLCALLAMPVLAAGGGGGGGDGPGGQDPAKQTGAYKQAMDAGLWSNTYAATNQQEYWAEGVQSYFDTNIEANPSNGIHNHVNTRAELLAYDRRLHDLIQSAFGSTPRPRICP